MYSLEPPMPSANRATRRAAKSARAAAPLSRVDRLNSLFLSGRFDSVVQIVQSIPAPARDDYDWLMLGRALAPLGKHREAHAAFERSVSLSGGRDADARFARALHLLRLGNYEEGWRELEARFSLRQMWPLGGPAQLWQSPLNGRPVAVWEEQGAGDTIMMLRFLPQLIASGADVSLAVTPDLARLVSASPVGAGAKVETVQKHGLTLHRYDHRLLPNLAVCPILSLPRALGTTEVPAAPYLAAPADLIEPWRSRIRVAAGERLRVGLCWAGDPSFALDGFRSPRLRTLRPILGVDSVQFFGLQLGDGRRDLAGRQMPANFTDLGPELRDFADTAAVIAGLDLVITSCTSIAHLAGAMGKPVWVLLGADPFWCWGTEPERSAWYPTARLFRQARPGDWSDPVRRVKAALEATGIGDSIAVTQTTVLPAKTQRFVSRRICFMC